MTTIEKTTITVEATIDAPVEKVWTFWTDPKHIIRWNFASEDWHTPRAKNDLKVGGKFFSRMEAKDGSAGFDFEGKYTTVELHKLIEYVLEDERKVSISFVSKGDKTFVKETFDAEQLNSVELQKGGWQSILNNFKTYVEKSDKFEPLHFEIEINAPAEKVFKTMLDEKKYREWTAIFNPTSHYKGSWKKGSKILFIGTDNDGNVGGMISKIKENIPNKYISIEHLGFLQGDKEVLSGPEIENWSGALENYYFSDMGNKTLLCIDTDTNEEFKSFLIETWPAALNKLKEIAESK